LNFTLRIIAKALIEDFGRAICEFHPNDRHCGSIEDIPQGLKPDFIGAVAARLKSCSDTKADHRHAIGADRLAVRFGRGWPGPKGLFYLRGHFHGLKPVAFSVALLRSTRGRTGPSGADRLAVRFGRGWPGPKGLFLCEDISTV
jgi:hypothetical protein